MRLSRSLSFKIRRSAKPSHVKGFFFASPATGHSSSRRSQTQPLSPSLSDLASTFRPSSLTLCVFFALALSPSQLLQTLLASLSFSVWSQALGSNGGPSESPTGRYGRSLNCLVFPLVLSLIGRELGIGKSLSLQLWLIGLIRRSVSVCFVSDWIML